MDLYKLMRMAQRQEGKKTEVWDGSDAAGDNQPLDAYRRARERNFGELMGPHKVAEPSICLPARSSQSRLQTHDAPQLCLKLLHCFVDCL